MKREYIATEPTFVDGVRRKRGDRFRTAAEPSKTWKPVESSPEEAESGEDDEALAQARQEYELVLGKKPHHMMKEPGLRKAIDEAKEALAE